MKRHSKKSVGTPIGCRIVEVLFDQYLSRMRWALWPFYMTVMLWAGCSRMIWLCRNEYIKRKFASCGKGVRIYGRFQITGSNRLSLGNNVHINENAFIRAEGGLEIGDNTHIARNIVIYTMNHNYKGNCLPYDQQLEYRPVRIGKNVWIGINVTIIPGVTIGDGAVIGMGCVVSKDVPPLSIVGMKHQIRLKERDRVHYLELEKARCYGGMCGYRMHS